METLFQPLLFGPQEPNIFQAGGPDFQLVSCADLVCREYGMIVASFLMRVKVREVLDCSGHSKTDTLVEVHEI